MLTDHAARLAAQAHLTVICLDFDGTLAPIVDDPNEARPLPGTAELLGHLAARFAAVALLSGRPADYLAKHAAAPGVRYLGLYGLQEIRNGHGWVDPRLEAARPAVMAAQQDLRDCAAVRDSGAYLEDNSMALPFIRGGSPTPPLGRRPSIKQLGRSPNVTGWTSYSASWSGSCAQPCAATRVMLFGGSSAIPTPSAWSWPGTISVTFPHLLLRLSCRLTGATCHASQWTLPRLHQPSSTKQMSSLTGRLDCWSSFGDYSSE
jgi:hypothetical protein